MTRVPRALIVALVAFGCTRRAPPPSASAPAVPPPRDDGRLPRTVHPTRYALDFTIDPAQPRFSGRAQIDVVFDEAASAIVLNARGLTIKSAALVRPDGRVPATPALRLAAGSKDDPEELVLTFDRVIPTGPAQIEIEYEGPFAGGLRGLYRVQEAGRWYAFTQFEPNDARRAFPCFDEPGWKTPFTVTIAAPPDMVALSNMHEAGRRPDGAQVRFAFDPSPPLPTYLVALAVGAFDTRDGRAGQLPVRLVAVSGKAGLGGPALATARGELVELETYFGRPFPYAKLDLLAVPSFGAGAMENAGLITFREERMLLDEHASLGARLGMAGLIAHEAAHQWFGDLVTMAWWNDLWLNEAFATFVAAQIVDAWRPATGARLQALATKSEVMEDDALATARRIRQPVRSTSEALEAFDSVTYEKGSAVLAMAEAWLGPDVFRAGLRGYLQRHEWGNATADDLYAALGNASGRDVASVMRSFTDQVGVPTIDAHIICAPGKAPAINLNQSEYRTLERTGDSPTRWKIPICVDVAGKPGGPSRKYCTLLESYGDRVELDADAPCPGFVYANADEAGYYRVQIHEEDLAALGPAVSKLPERERFGVVSNAWASVRAGQLPVKAFLDLLPRLARDPSRLVWREAIAALRAIDRALVTDADRPVFARFVRELTGPSARRLGWRTPEAESDDDHFMREQILATLGDLGEDGPTLAEAGRRARAWLQSPSAEGAELARIAVPLAAKRADTALFDLMLGVVKKPPTPEIRIIALSGLASLDDRALIERTLALVLDGTIRAQDLRYLFPALGLRRAASDVFNAWVERHFDELARLFPSFTMGRLVRALPALCDAARVRAADESLRPRAAKLEGVEKDLRQSVEEGLRCAALAGAARADTSRWLHHRL